MAKKEIAKSFSNQAGIPMGQALSIVQSVFDGIIQTLVSKVCIELCNPGVFEVRKRRARKGRNPRTDAVVVAPEHPAISFKAWLVMQERVKAHFSTAA